jgi:hypothetical protein
MIAVSDLKSGIRVLGEIRITYAGMRESDIQIGKTKIRLPNADLQEILRYIPEGALRDPI